MSKKFGWQSMMLGYSRLGTSIFVDLICISFAPIWLTMVRKFATPSTDSAIAGITTATTLHSILSHLLYQPKPWNVVVSQKSFKFSKKISVGKSPDGINKTFLKDFCSLKNYLFCFWKLLFWFFCWKYSYLLYFIWSAVKHYKTGQSR